MRGKTNAIVLMSRIPRPGLTKTRMMPQLTGQQCADLHACFIRDELRSCLSADAETFLSYAPDLERHLLEDALAPLGDQRVNLFCQEGEGLGARLSHAVEFALEQGFQKCLVLGSDVPEITTELISLAFDQLDDHDVVLGPAMDGGFYLIGMGKLFPEAFSLSRYGRSGVFEETLSALEAHCRTVCTLPLLHDLDTYGDAASLVARHSQHECGLESVAFLRQSGVGLCC